MDPMEVAALGAAYQAEHAEDTGSSPLVVAHALTRNLGTSALDHDATGVLRDDLFSCIIPAMTIEITFEYGIDQTLEVEVEIPGHGWKRRWVPERQRQLEASHRNSQAKIDEVFERSLTELRALAARAELALSDRDAPRSREALAELNRALEAKDAPGARERKSALMGALFDEEIELARE